MSGMGWADVDPNADATAAGVGGGITGGFLGSTAGLNTTMTLEQGMLSSITKHQNYKLYGLSMT